MQIHVDCEKNLVFSKYSVDVSIDGEGIGKVEHGDKVTFDLNLAEGQHELVFEEEGRTSPDGKTTFVVKGEGDQFAYRIKCTKDQIEIESIDEIAKDQSDEEAEPQESDMQVVSYDGASIEVPSTWEVVDADDGKYVYSEYGAMVYLHANDLEMTQPSADEEYAEIIAGLLETGQYTVAGDVKKSNTGGGSHLQGCDNVADRRSALCW